MNLTIGFQTHTGNVRSTNQDSFAVLKRGDLSHRLDALLVLADGMGGSGGGDIASSIVAQAVPDGVIEFLADRTGGGTPDVKLMLDETMTRANHKVWTTRKMERPDLRQMGTTAVIAVVNDGVLTIANLGDSRAYLLRAGRLRQITEDHSEVWEQVKLGQMTEKEAQNSRFRNRITRAVGLGPDVNTDIFRETLQEGDTVLLCSDGLSTEISNADIARIMAGIANIQDVCDRLVDAALDHGGKDNITVVALRYGNFVPLTLPPAVDEDDTDPDQKWKTQISRQRPGDEEDEEENVSPSRRPASRPSPVVAASHSASSQRQPSSAVGALIGVLILMTAVAGVEGYLLYKSGYFGPQKAGQEPPIVRPKPAYDPGNYGTPQLLLKDKEVQDACLMIDDKGNPIVASQTGNLMRILSNGTQELLGGTFPSLPPQTSPAPPNAHSPHGVSLAPARADFALDPSGNLFAIDAETKSISIYSNKGTRIGHDIGRQVLKSPVRIAVNSEDTVFIIDNLKLYRIMAKVLESTPTTADTGH